MRVFNAFVPTVQRSVSSVKRVHLRREKVCLSPAQNLQRKISSAKRVCSSPAQNSFVCNVKLYSEVSCRDYLVASNKCVRLQFVRCSASFGHRYRACVN